VQSGGTLTGNGTLLANVEIAGGVLTAGNSVGQLNINGDLSFTAPGSQLVIEVTGSGGAPGIDYDQIVVDGAVSGLQQMDLVVEIGPNVILSESDQIVILTSGLTEMSNLNVNSLTLLSDAYSGTLLLGANQLILTNFQLIPIPEPGTSSLLGLAGLMWAGVRRRKRNAAQN